MTSESGKVTRRLTVKLEPMRGKRLSVTVADSTTRSREGTRHTEAEIAADTWTEQAAVESFKLVLMPWLHSLGDEDPGELFAEEKSPKPKLDK